MSEDVRSIELTAFENDSVLNQKSLSLPIGKVSIRQTAILFAGILVTFLVFLSTDNLIASGAIFAIFLGIGLIGTKVMTADQLIKSHLMMVIRGTSLEQKPEYMQKNKNKNKKNDIGSDLFLIHSNGNKNGQSTEESQQPDNSVVNQALSQIKSLYKGNTNGKNISSNNKKKKYFAAIALNDQNILNITTNTSKNNNSKNNKNSSGSSTQTIPKENKKDNPVDNLLNTLTKNKKLIGDENDDHSIPINNIPQITVSLDGIQITDKMVSVKKSKETLLSVPLEENKRYSITAIVDDDGDDQKENENILDKENSDHSDTEK